MKNRIIAIDLARALAIFGMVWAHTAPGDGNDFFDVLRVLTFGLPSSLFAVLCGVSVALMSDRPIGRGEAAAIHHKLLVRGLTIVALGLAVEMLHSFIYTVLMALGLVIIVLAAVPRLTNTKILAMAAILLIVGPLIEMTAITDGFLRNAYPLCAWITYGLAGILVKRLLLEKKKVQWKAATVGTVIASTGIIFHQWVLRTWEPVYSKDFSHDDPFTFPSIRLTLWQWITPHPHTGGLMDQVICIAGAVAVIGWLLILCRKSAQFEATVRPLAALGSMSLSFYVLHVMTAGYLFSGLWDFVLSHLLPDGAKPPLQTIWVLANMVLFVWLAVLWKKTHPKGPLENFVNWVIANATQPAARPLI